MQWTSGPKGGFTSGTPWLPTHDPRRTNVSSQRDDPDSLLSLYRHLIGLRRRSAAIRHGALELVPGLPSGVVGYVRASSDARVLVLANMSPRPATITDLSGRGSAVAATGDRRGTLELGKLDLQPLEGIVLEMRATEAR
jgi:glycosidase